jgi:membrane protein DedA with SNARE-associated domain
MRFRDFLVAIFLGRFVRFLVLSVLVLWFGPEIVELFGGVVKQHWVLVLAAIGAGLGVWLVMRWRGRAVEAGVSDR